jgi:hypothetical protein
MSETTPAPEQLFPDATEYAGLTPDTPEKVIRFVTDLTAAGYKLVQIERPYYTGPAVRVHSFDIIKGLTQDPVTTTADNDGTLLVYPILALRD